jgi:hypothetical protein
MDQKLTAIERAFQIAKSGHAPTVEHIKQALAKEGYAQGQINGPSLSRQLRALIKAAREKDNTQSS